MTCPEDEAISSSSSDAEVVPDQYFGIDVSALCSKLPRPIIMTGVLRDVLSRHFYAAERIEEPDLRHLIWKDGQTTGILIETVHRWRPELTEMRPGVILRRNSYQNLRMGIGDRRQAPLDSDGYEHYTTYWTGSHTLFCIGGSGAQAELLGAEVERELLEFGPVIAAKLNLKRWQVLQIGTVAELEEAQQNYAVPITVGYAYEQRWIVRPQVPRLNRISVSMIIES